MRSFLGRPISCLENPIQSTLRCEGSFEESPLKLPKPQSDATRSFERRLNFHALLGRAFFYVPVLVMHIHARLAELGIERAHAVTMSLFALFALGIAIAEVPSGVFADWGGRARSLILGSAIYAIGLGLLWAPGGGIAMLAFSQLSLGVASSFRSGADTALLYSQLERNGETERYGAAISRLRFYNLAGLTLASAAGGVLYSWRPGSVFAVTGIALFLGTLPLFGIEDPVASGTRPSYWRVMRDGANEMRRNRGAQALVFLGGMGATYFIYAYWSISAYLVDVGTSPTVLGQVLAGAALLQAASMALSAWIAARVTRYTPIYAALTLGLAATFAAVALAHRAGLHPLAATALVVGAVCAPLYRNLINIRLQPLVPDRVRASLVSVEAWVGAAYYVLFFPVGGWLLDSFGVVKSYTALACWMTLSVAPLLLWARRQRL